jgi:phosphatidylserine/phosphatidylglycerophosphate/cardiolipin synthase-like enzyme
MGLWSWLANRIDHFFHDPTDNVNNGLIANPFLVKKIPVANHYHVGAEFGQIQGAVQRTSTEFWASSDVGFVHVGLKPPDENQPSYALAAIINGLLRLVPAGQTFVVPRSDRQPFGKIEVTGPAYILESLDTAVDSFREKLNADVWIEAGLAPRNRPLPAVVVYENIDVSSDLDELIKTWIRLEKKLPFWTDTRVNELVASWKLGQTTAYVKAGYPIGQPVAGIPSGIDLPAGTPAGSRYVTISVYDEFGVPFDIGWLLRHADIHAENEIFDNLVAPNVEIFRKDPVRGLPIRRDIIDIRDEYGLPYRNRPFRILTEAEFSPLTSVFDKEAADLILENQPEITGASGIWRGPQVSAGNNVVIKGVGLKEHLLAFLPSCSSSTVVIKLRGYPGDYHRIIALPLNKWFPEQPNARPTHAPERYHLGCRVTPLIDAQSMQAAVANAIRATYEQGDSAPPDLRPPAARADARIWLCNWQISPATFPYGGSPQLYQALEPNPDDPNDPFPLGLKAYPPGSLGFYLQSAIAAGVDVRLMPWFAIFGTTPRDKNFEIARSVNFFYDVDAYFTVNGPGPETARAPQEANPNSDPNLKRGFAFVDDVVRSQGSHHQKVSFIRNRYGNFAFLGGLDLVPSRWDTNMHKTPEERKVAINPVASPLVAGWHDVHAMLEGPVVLDVAKNFFQRWNAFVADPPDDLEDYPVDIDGVTPIQALPIIPEEGVPDWPGPASELEIEAPIDPHTTLDRGDEGRRPRRATQVCAIVRTIPPFIDAYDGFVKARPIPANGEPIGELGCRESYLNALENARNYVYLEDQYFVEPDFVELLIERLTDADPKLRLRRLFIIVPHILADQQVVDAVYHHKRRQHRLAIQQAVRNRLALDRGGIDPATVPQEDIDKIFTLAHLEHPSGTEIYLHAKHMIVDDIWMVISSSNFSRRGMTYETEIGVAITDAEVEDGVRKVVRDHRIRLWAEHLRLDRSHWHRLLDPIAGAELLRQALDNPNLPLIPFEVNNAHIEFSYPADNHTDEHELVYRFLADPDGQADTDPGNVELARAALAAILGG